MIADASREIRLRSAESERSRAEASRNRRRIAAIDAFIGELEERHLGGERTFDRLLHQRLRHLEREVGLPLPRRATRARNTVRLHAALLDWQEAFLDVVLPERLGYADVHDSDWANPHPVGWESLEEDRPA